MQELISAIDVGTTKICVLMASVTHDSLGNLALNVMGEGQVPSRGIRRGVVVNVPEVTDAIAEAIEKCEQDGGQSISSAYVGIAGSHIGTLNSKGVSPVDRRYGITGQDMQRALEGARAVALPENQEIVHTIARQWTVDGQNHVQQPLGMSAYRLEVDAHIVIGNSTAVGNLVQCVLQHGIDIDELVLEPLASNEAVLKTEERHMGVAVVDMGGGTSDIAIFIDNGLCHTVVLDVGGNHLSNDIAVGLHTSFASAEDLKLKYGHVIPSHIMQDETIWVKVFGEQGEQRFSRRFISQILEARAIEMFEIIRQKLIDSKYYDKLPAGVVLTGGASQLTGMSELGSDILGLPVRIGSPSTAHLPITGLSRQLQTPTYATGTGMLLWGLYEDARSVHRRFESDVSSKQNEKPTSIWPSQAASWLRNLLPD